MKWGYVSLVFLLVLVPTQAQENQFDSWYFSSQIKAGQRFVWLSNNQIYESPAEVPLDQYGENITLVVKQTPGNIDVRSLIDDDYFDYYVNGSKEIITQNLFTKDFMFANYIIPTRYNESGNYFDWYAQNHDNSSIDGDFFYYKPYGNFSDLFGLYSYEFEYVYYIPNGALVSYKSTTRNATTGELIRGGSEFLIYPNLSILLTTSSTTTSVPPSNGKSDQQLSVGLPRFMAVQTLALIIIVRRRIQIE